MRSCPITSEYLLNIPNANASDTLRYNFYSELTTLKMLAGSAGNSTAVQHLRAFVCVEYLLIALGVKLQGFLPKSFVNTAKDIIAIRSSTSLTSIINLIASAKEEAKADHIHYANYSDSVDAEWKSCMYDITFKYLDICDISCCILRSALNRNNTAGLSSIGAALANACALIKSVDLRAQLSFAEHLIQVTEISAPRIWEFQKT